MKIALFSPYSSQNYGTVLQAFALAKVIADNGVSCEYIKWRHCKSSIISRILFLLRHPSYIYLHLKNAKLNSEDLSYSFLSQPEYKEVILKNEAFVSTFTPHTFEEYTYDQLKALSQRYNRFIVGSDQTWNPSHIYQFSPYYLTFVKDNSRKFSYGCSLGRTSLPEQFLKFLDEKLQSFNSLSCREKGNAFMLSCRLGKTVKHVLDPTLLLDRDTWRQYMKPIEGMPKPFILCYILGERQCISEYADFLSKTTNLPAYYILTRPCHEGHQHVLKGVGVQEFLWLIDNCSYLVTDSFHGTIFAINFGKDMISFDKYEGEMFDNGRIQDILSSYKLESHYMNKYEERIPTSYNMADISEALSKKRQDSLHYLKAIIH